MEGTIQRGLSRDDVLLGRGTASNEHEGNVRFRAIVMNVLQRSTIYRTAVAPPFSKSTMAVTVLAAVQERGGNFVRKITEADAVVAKGLDVQQRQDSPLSSPPSGTTSEEDEDTVASSSPTTTSAAPKAAAAMYVVVSRQVALEKVKQSFRHQQRVMMQYSDQRKGNTATKLAREKAIQASAATAAAARQHQAPIPQVATAATAPAAVASKNSINHGDLSRSAIRSALLARNLFSNPTPRPGTSSAFCSPVEALWRSLLHTNNTDGGRPLSVAPSTASPTSLSSLLAELQASQAVRSSPTTTTALSVLLSTASSTSPAFPSLTDNNSQRSAATTLATPAPPTVAALHSALVENEIQKELMLLRRRRLQTQQQPQMLRPMMLFHQSSSNSNNKNLHHPRAASDLFTTRYNINNNNTGPAAESVLREAIALAAVLQQQQPQR